MRVIATTNRRLREEVAAGRFREDLYYRLNVFPLTPLPLRSRRDDVLPLAMRLLAAHSRPGARIPALHPDAAQRLLTYAWPGNVRELENVMQRALVLCDGDLIREAHIVFEPPAERPSTPPGGGDRGATHGATDGSGAAGEPRAGAQLAESLALAEQQIILQALRSHGSRERVAAQLGISPRTLRYKLARLRARRHRLPRSTRREARDERHRRSIRCWRRSVRCRRRPARASSRRWPPSTAAATARSAAQAARPSARLLKQGIDAVNTAQQSADALADAWERGVPGRRSGAGDDRDAEGLGFVSGAHRSA